MRKDLSEYLSRRGPPVMTCILVGVILSSPLADTHRRIGAFVGLVVLACVLTGASFAGNKRIAVLVGIPLAALWFAARLLDEFGDGRHAYEYMAHLAGLALSCTILWAMFDRLKRTPTVTSSVIAEAGMVYLIIAIAYSQLYWILGELVEQPFNMAIPDGDGTSYLYFSMITLTSVGYGGIYPVNPYVRLVAAFESMTGIFYIAIVVAQLVSSYRKPVI